MRLFVVNNKLLPIFILLLGALLGYFILFSGDHKPANYKKNKANRIRIVQTSELVNGSVVPFWKTSGFVIPAEAVKVYARVSGNIEAINPLAMPGGQLKKGQWLAQLEAVDFEITRRSQQAQLAQAQANFSLEEADQIIAKEELALLSHHNELGIDQSLVLREPQLTVAKAKVSVAINNLEKAELNLQRTKVLMPFDGAIMSKSVGLASKVSSSTLLFEVVNTDTYWIEVKIPHKFLSLLDQAQTAEMSQSRLWGKGKKRQARFISILPELDSKDRQVKVLLAIDSPNVTNDNSPQVFINDFLNVELKGKAIKDAWVIKHPWLLPDKTMWVVDKNSTLQKRAVEVLFKGRDLIYIQSTFEKGDRALAEKPGIAAVGLQVKTRKSRVKKLKQENQVNKVKGLTNER
ncbi:MAG: efflux RND transporter periplasmic adaptor subunit [Alteromonadaceae bacterium]|nr:efflux RND transporter periplasmic adaptor subunit [Alteromonadaceae bacterium]